MLCREAGDTGVLAWALNVRGVVARQQGDLGCAVASYEESLTLYRGLEDAWAIAIVLNQMRSQVLVHASSNSVVLTIRQPRQLMTGQGVTAAGATFSVTWRCVAASGARPKATTSAPAAGRLDDAPQAREVC